MNDRANQVVTFLIFVRSAVTDTESEYSKLIGDFRVSDLMILTDVLGEDFWARHTNPWSGYTRLPMGPVLLLGLYRRDWRMVGLTLLYVAINPVLFPEPETKDAWISRSVLGEQLWLEDGHEVFEASPPGALNVLNAVAYFYGLYGAYKRNPRVTALGGGVALTCKLVYLHILVKYYDENAPDRE